MADVQSIMARDLVLVIVTVNMVKIRTDSCKFHSHYFGWTKSRWLLLFPHNCPAPLLLFRGWDGWVCYCYCYCYCCYCCCVLHYVLLLFPIIQRRCCCCWSEVEMGGCGVRWASPASSPHCTMCNCSIVTQTFALLSQMSFNCLLFTLSQITCCSKLWFVQTIPLSDGHHLPPLHIVEWATVAQTFVLPSQMGITCLLSTCLVACAIVACYILGIFFCPLSDGHNLPTQSRLLCTIQTNKQTLCFVQTVELHCQMGIKHHKTNPHNVLCDTCNTCVSSFILVSTIGPRYIVLHKSSRQSSACTCVCTLGKF